MFHRGSGINIYAMLSLLHAKVVLIRKLLEGNYREPYLKLCLKYDWLFSLNCYRDATTKISEIISELGEASARAQGLSKAVTTGQKLRNSDHTVYLLSEKTGKK